jgi:acetyl esterase/lipase
VLRDEGEAYARKLSQAGVRVTSTRYNGTIHDFVLLNAPTDTPAVRGALHRPMPHSARLSISDLSPLRVTIRFGCREQARRGPIRPPAGPMLLGEKAFLILR